MIWPFSTFSFFNRSRCPCFITSLSFHFTFLGQCHFLLSHFLLGRNLQQLTTKECACTFCIRQLKQTNTSFSMRLCLLGSTNKMGITSWRSLKFIGFIKPCLEVKAISKMEKFIWNDNHKGIIIFLTTNLIAAFHGTVPAGCSCSFSSIIPLFILGGMCGEKPGKNVKQEVLT